MSRVCCVQCLPVRGLSCLVFVCIGFVMAPRILCKGSTYFVVAMQRMFKTNPVLIISENKRSFCKVNQLEMFEPSYFSLFQRTFITVDD